MITAINLLSVIPMRKEPAHRSEMVSQLIFGEYTEILEEKEDFIRVKCLYDGYEGWVQANQLVITDNVLQTETWLGSWCGEVLVNGNCVNIPLCSPIYNSASGIMSFGKNEMQYVLNDGMLWNSKTQEIDKDSLEKIYTFFTNTPYLWGGKSVFGIDCSGFVQQVYKMFGIKLLRDAYLQAEQGEKVRSVEQAKLGDLAFFQNEKGRVTHVGIILKDNQIVHASGKVRIDDLDGTGITNRDTGKRTHELHSIKRIF
jgi:gamma-D-glutamyl-L-lysine dipeptidyl-peptidase